MKWSRPICLCVGFFFSAATVIPAESKLAELQSKADGGNVDAQLRLAMMYANGDGVDANLVRAASFYSQAALQGNATAQFNLASLLFSGDGVPKDFVLAHVWWNISGANGNKEAKLKLTTLEPQMTPEQKAHAMTAAREVFARIQKRKTDLENEAKKKAESKEGFASNVAPLTDPPFARIANRTKEENPAGVAQDADGSLPATDPLRPRPRPSGVKTQQVRPKILAERLAGTANIGPTSVDARWSPYGAYLQKMIEAVQIQWERLLTESKIYPTSGSTVTVKFVMDSKGLIARVVNVDSTASDSASRACMSAITDRAPYGDWTEDMKAVLGDRQEITLTFYYQ